MQDAPRYGIAVSDLNRSVAFYRDQIGMTVDRNTGLPDTAVLIGPNGPKFMLAGPAAPPWDEILADQFTALQHKDTIFVSDPEFEKRLAQLREHRVEFELIERSWGERKIEVVDPDGYRLSLWMLLERSRMEILELFRMGRDGLRAAIQGLSEEELRWRQEPDSWSVREVVHHIVDSEITVLHALRVALASPGGEYHANPYDQALFARRLHYQERDIEPALRMFEAMRDLMTGMIEVEPDAWECSVRTRGGETTVETYMLMLATHALEHIEQIRQVREALAFNRA
jgi:catechol 2,3-dioxygenase-like lactoylglutathione lyase family enzyme